MSSSAEPERLPAAYFQRLYAASADPWSMEGSWYEQRKRACVLAALPEARYRRAFEPGCAGGLLTACLVERCDEVVSWDASTVALRQARARLPPGSPARLEAACVPDAWPEGSFDLLVVSEIGYYLSAPVLDALIARGLASLEPLGTLVAVHWRHPAADYPLTGDEVHARLRSTPGLARVVDHVEEDFVLEVFLRVPAGSPFLSVAARAGML